MKKKFLPMLFIAIVLGFFVPGGQRLKPLLPVFLSILLLFNFYKIDVEVKDFFRQELVFYVLVELILFPAIVFNITKNLSDSFRVGIFLVAITPTAISSSVVVGMIKGNLTLSIAHIMIFNLLAPFSYSLLLRLYFTAPELNISIKHIMTKLLLLVGIPFLASLILKRIRTLTSHLQMISSYANFLFIILVFTAVSSSSQQIHTISGRELLFVVVSLVSIALVLYISGFLLGKNMASKKTLAVSMGQKNNSLCIWLALTHFDPLTALPATVNILIQHIMNFLLISLFSQKKEGTP